MAQDGGGWSSKIGAKGGGYGGELMVLVVKFQTKKRKRMEMEEMRELADDFGVELRKN